MRCRIVTLSLLAGLALCALPLRAATQFPAFTGYVVDSANIIDPQNRALITQIASQLDHNGYAQLAVCTVPTLGDVSKEEYANELFKAWGLGHGKKADGVLVLIVPGPAGQRKIKVEVGYGMEGLLNDGKVGAMLDEYAVPQLKQNAYGQAAADLSNAISQVINADAAGGGSSRPEANGMRGGVGQGGGSRALPPSTNPDDAGIDRGVGGLALAVIAMGALLILLLSSASRGQFPGVRTGIVALVLTGMSVAGLLALGGLLGWLALGAGLVANGLAYASIRSRKCPKCGGFLSSSEEIVRSPTFFSPGAARVTERCSNCGYSSTTTRSIPRRARSVYVGGGGWGGGGWGGGGGGWGGGGDSGGGFSGGGGGDSGGGGAGRDV